MAVIVYLYLQLGQVSIQINTIALYDEPIHADRTHLQNIQHVIIFLKIEAEFTALSEFKFIVKTEVNGQ